MSSWKAHTKVLKAFGSFTAGTCQPGMPVFMEGGVLHEINISVFLVVEQGRSHLPRI